MALERRRAGYIPAGTKTRVFARMNADELAARQTGRTAADTGTPTYDARGGVTLG